VYVLAAIAAARPVAAHLRIRGDIMTDPVPAADRSRLLSSSNAKLSARKGSAFSRC
jgi:hypothetical protein